MNVQNTLLSTVTYPPAVVNIAVTAAIPINDSTIVVSPFLTTNKSEFIYLLPFEGESVNIRI